MVIFRGALRVVLSELFYALPCMVRPFPAERNFPLLPPRTVLG